MKQIFKLLGLTLFLITTNLLGEKVAPVEIESLHDDIWKRFVQSNGLLLDYNTPEGNVALPTAEECLNGKPNAISWWTPIENGPFFTGLYIEASILRWQMTGSEADRVKVKRLADGLLLSASVSELPGFVARGVLPDGRSHYAIGSDDQTGPWFYGLWRYLRSGAAREEDKKQVIEKMVEVATALKKNNWRLPCDALGSIKPGQTRGSFATFEYRTAPRILFVARIVQELTGRPEWGIEYEDALTNLGTVGKDKVPKTRLELIEEGMPAEFLLQPGMAKNQLWIFINAQAMVRELAALETRTLIREKYFHSLRINAKLVAESVTDTPPTDLESTPFNADWRVMNEVWKPQTNIQEVMDLAMLQVNKIWKNRARSIEISGLREPFSAACLVFLSPEKNEEVVERFLKLTRKVEWKKLYSSYSFLAEIAWYLMSRFP